MNRCAFLMSSCDVYEDLWEPFFECLERFGYNDEEEKELKVYLNTEHKQFVPKKALKFDVITLNQLCSSELSWSKRFIQALERIEDEYIFLVLDDFFVCENIDWRYFSQIIDIMEADSSIASFQLYGTRARNRNTRDYHETEELTYTLMERSGWKTHFVPTIWRKSILLKWLRPWESIWAFEGAGSARARHWNYPEKVMVVQSPPVYDYLWIKDCSAVINGKWLAEPELLNFFEDNKISVDWSKRGKMTHQEYLDITMTDVIKKYSFSEIIIKCFNRIRSWF